MNQGLQELSRKNFVALNFGKNILCSPKNCLLLHLYQLISSATVHIALYFSEQQVVVTVKRSRRVVLRPEQRASGGRQ